MLDAIFNRLITKFFVINLLEGSAASVFDSINNLFDQHDIPRVHWTGIGLDNTNANIGEQNLIKSQAYQKNDN